MRTNDPMRRYYRFFFILEGIVIILLLSEAVVFTVVGRPNYFVDGSAALLLLLVVWAFFAIRRRHQRTEIRRQRALANDLSFLAQPQPTPNSSALALPVRISLRLDMKRFLKFMGIFYALLALVPVGILAFFLPSFGGMLLFIVIFLFVVFMFIVFLITGFIVLVIMKPFIEQEIVVDEQSITTKFYRQVTRIPWSEVQSFAMWGSTKRFSAIPFELVSEQGVAHWIQLGPRNKFLTRLSMLRPDMPFDEYHDKMNRLQQVIVARTGKPLYDLRDEKMVWW